MVEPGDLWEYDPGEQPKRKHAWNKNEAGFVRKNEIMVGKCPRGFDLNEARGLLNKGIPMPSMRGSGSHPRRIYVVYNGVLYRAVPTRPGFSYHAFPEIPSEFEKLDDQLKTLIWERARADGTERELKRWLKQVW